MATTRPSQPVGFNAAWISVIKAGGLDDAADLSTPFRPDTGIATTSRVPVTRSPTDSTSFITRAFYDATNATCAGGTFRVFGRYNPNILIAGVFATTTTPEAWSSLRNKAGNITRTPPYDVTNDASDGTLKYTTVDILEDVWDAQGCNEFRFGTTAAHTCTTGSAALAGLQMKGI
jgi:hypothetical protein